MGQPMRSGRKTSVYVHDDDAKKLDALSMSASEAIREFCASRGPDGMPLRAGIVLHPDEWETLDALGMSVVDVVREFCAGESVAASQVVGVTLLSDPGARDPSDRKPDKPPACPHGWTFTGTLQRQPDGTDKWVGQMIARPASLDELARLVSTAPGKVRLAASHVLIVAEVNDV